MSSGDGFSVNSRCLSTYQTCAQAKPLDLSNLASAALRAIRAETALGVPSLFSLNRLCYVSSLEKALIIQACFFQVRLLGGRDVKFHRLYSDDEGESHWEDVNVTLHERPFAPPAKAIEISEPEKVEKLLFLRLIVGWDEPIHPTPVAQKLICLAGSVRVTASDGQVRDIGPGDVWHMEDKHGKGHHTAVTSDTDFEAVIVQYE